MTRFLAILLVLSLLFGAANSLGIFTQLVNGLEYVAQLSTDILLPSSLRQNPTEYPDLKDEILRITGWDEIDELYGAGEWRFEPRLYRHSFGIWLGHDDNIVLGYRTDTNTGDTNKYIAHLDDDTYGWYRLYGIIGIPSYGATILAARVVLVRETDVLLTEYLETI